MKLFRKMYEDPDGKPTVGNTSMKLGVRPADPAQPYRKSDVPAVNGSDVVNPGEGGLSCYSDPGKIRIQSKKLVLWSIEEKVLPQGLIVRPDSNSHYLIEPSRGMTLDDLQNLLADSRDDWTREEVDES